jgi:hypothetical protein
MGKPLPEIGVPTIMREAREETWALAIEVSNPSAETGAARGATGPSVAAARVLSWSNDHALITTLGAVEVEPLDPTGRHDDDLMPAIDRLSRRLGLTAGGLVRTCVSVGPGGFTGLRVAVSTAKMLSEVTGCDTVAVPSAIVAAHTLDAGDLPAAVCLASKRDTAHVTTIDAVPTGSDPRSATALGVIDHTAFARLDVRTVVADRHLPGGWSDAIDTNGWSRVEPAFCAGACLRLGAGFRAIDAAGLAPVYPREPEAVTVWKQRGRG